MIDTLLGKVLDEFQKDVFASKKRGDFIKAFERISARYRKQEGLFLQTEEERLVYLFTRLPGTFSAISKVLNEIQARCYLLSFDSFLDVGAGPGTGMWAAFESLDAIKKYTLLEQDLQFMAIGKDLARRSLVSSIQNADWKICNLEKTLGLEPHDLVLLSYSIGEIKEEKWQGLLTDLWRNANKALVIIEPGTPSGYLRLMKIREILKGLGGYLWAPCPHNLTCPLAKDDWCHFSVRVQRSSLHRQLKSADLGYEDEKFSYLVFGKEPIDHFRGRILRHPIKHPGYVEMVVCQESGIKKEIYSKKDKTVYKAMKKMNWGDICDLKP